MGFLQVIEVELFAWQVEMCVIVLKNLKSHSTALVGGPYSVFESGQVSVRETQFWTPALLSLTDSSNLGKLLNFSEFTSHQ